jgi:hypothetical protein
VVSNDPEIYFAAKIKVSAVFYIDPDSEHIEACVLNEEMKKYNLKKQGHDFEFTCSLDTCQVQSNLKEIR